MRKLLIFIMLSISGFVSAADLNWRVRDYAGYAGYPSALSACQAFISGQTLEGYHFTYRDLVQLPDSGPSKLFNCRYYRTYTATGESNSLGAVVISDSGTCTEGTYNPATGACDVPGGPAGEECEGPEFYGMPAIYNSQGECKRWDEADKPSTCKALSKSGTSFTDVYVSFDGDGNPEKKTVEKLGCEASVVDVAQCKMPVPKCGQGICVQRYVSKCKVAINFTGNTVADAGPSPFPVATGPGEEGACTDAFDCTPPDEPVVEEKQPCNYMYNGQVVGCESSEFKGDPGEMNCGRINNGPYECHKKVPTSTGVDIRTKITTEPQSDGTSKQTKEDTHTKTVCSAPGSCTTQVTNNKTVIHKDGNGNTISETSECTGANCGKGMGDKANCKPGEECSEEEDGEFGGPDNDEVPGFGESLQGFKAKLEAAPIIAGVKGISMPSGGSCSMSSASTPIGTISGDTVCQNSNWLDPLYGVFLAIGALNAVRILMSA